MPRMSYYDRNESVIDKCAVEIRPLLRWIHYKLSRMGQDVLFVEGRRDAETQNSYVKAGTSKVKFPYSYHNHGLAIDIVPVVYGMPWKLDWGFHNRYKLIAGVFKQYGFEWGYDLWGWDKPHMQYRQGKPILYFVDGGKADPNIYKRVILDDAEIEESKLENGLRHARGNRRYGLEQEYALVRSIGRKISSELTEMLS